MEQSCTVWHSSLSRENTSDLERVQKNALRNILQEKYIDYGTALETLKLETLEKRREKLLLKYGKQCIKLEQTRNLLPLNENDHIMNTRSRNIYKETKCNTERYRKSAVPYIQRLLNKEK